MSGAMVIILARAGSKGVPGKNTADVAGRACAEWTFDHAAASRRVSEVVVSTDDERLLAMAQSRGFAGVRRPANLATDSATVDDAARHAITTVDADGQSPVVILYANVPVRPADLTDRALDLLLGSGCDSVQSYEPVGKHHPWWTVKIGEGQGESRGVVGPWEGDTLYHGVYRRQELPPAYVPDGGVIAVARRALFGKIAGVKPGPHAFLGIDRRAVINPQGSVVDIDSPIDLVVADAILSRTQRKAASA